MKFQHVKIRSCVKALPDEVVTSAAIEDRLTPCYRRLKLPPGRLEMMTGIRERRVWPQTMLPSQAAAEAGRRALEASAVDPERVGCLIHCAVSRDFVEPATATSVHALLGLSPATLNFDISNACLGVLTGMIMVANMIELGQIEYGLLVAGEHSRPLMESTIRELNENRDLSRRDIKPLFASLTIGSAATAVLLERTENKDDSCRLLGGVHLCDTSQNHLCRGNSDAGMTGTAQALMQTDSEQLMLHGVKVAQQAWRQCREELDWGDDTPDRICTHQVGRIHRQHLYDALGLDIQRDISTVEFMGNCGSASLPATVAHASAAGQLKKGDRLAMLGIGSGINCTMLGVEW